MFSLVGLKSKEDSSVNFVLTEDGSTTEARYVRREPSYFICYLSSFDGCNKACRFCHLTRTGQVSMNPCTVEDIMHQALLVLGYYKGRIPAEGPAKTVHFNFMARGEPLSNVHILTRFDEIYKGLEKMAHSFGLDFKVKISTIMPKERDLGLSGKFRMEKVFSESNYPNLSFYYSMYSVNPKFRGTWLVNAMDPFEALDKLSTIHSYAGYSYRSNARVLTFHWPYIKGHNDSLTDVEETAAFIRENFKRRCKFNLVRYNPFSTVYGTESDKATITRNFNIMNEAMSDKSSSRIVPRVGFDVKASCGMFVK